MLKPLQFTPPPSMGEMAESLAAQLSNQAQNLAKGASKLSGLGLPALPSTGLDGIVKNLREKASGSMANPTKYLALTPYQYGVGTRKGEHGYLTPSAAIKGIADRLGEADADLLQKAQELITGEAPDSAIVLVLFAGVSPAGLFDALSSFNKVYPIMELQQAERRAKALATLEMDKFIIPKAPAFPPWGEAAPQKNAVGQATSKALGRMLAMNEAAAEIGKSPGAKLAEFANKQASELQKKAGEVQELVAKMIGQHSGWHGLYLEGAGAEIARLLAKAADNLPGLDARFNSTAALCWFGTKAQVSYYKEAFGLSNFLDGIL